MEGGSTRYFFLFFPRYPGKVTQMRHVFHTRVGLPGATSTPGTGGSKGAKEDNHQAGDCGAEEEAEKEQPSPATLPPKKASLGRLHAKGRTDAAGSFASDCPPGASLPRGRLPPEHPKRPTAFPARGWQAGLASPSF